jgi:hydroxymethylpyrimidine pyrophosphatase-like HAD family hydrolase
MTVGVAKRRLLAIDLDGTLVGATGAIDAEDLAAIARAQRLGISVVLATGRLASGALPHARALALRDPMICADGRVLACGRTGAALEQQTIAPAAASAVLRAIHAHGLAPFAFLADAIHGDSAFAHDAHCVRGWTDDVRWHAPLFAAEPWQELGLVIALGIGPRRSALAAARTLTQAHSDAIEVGAFPLADGVWAVRAQAPACSKGVALASLAARLDVARSDVAAIGDWWNDLPMLAWAGRSFAMEHAPAGVCDAASHVVPSVAAAIGLWLDGERVGW